MNKLLFITHTTEQYSTVDSVKIALKGGCRSIQLRMKNADVSQILETGKIVKQLCDSVQAELYIDDHPFICKELKATGVHLGKQDMSVPEARIFLGKEFIIGATANTYDDIRQLYEQGADYIGLGPFRFTTTKKNLSPVLGLEGYREIVSRCYANKILLPIVAIGGITNRDIPDILSTGVSAIALSSTILQAADPVLETELIMKQIKQYSGI